MLESMSSVILLRTDSEVITGLLWRVERPSSHYATVIISHTAAWSIFLAKPLLPTVTSLDRVAKQRYDRIAHALALRIWPSNLRQTPMTPVTTRLLEQIAEEGYTVSTEAFAGRWGARRETLPQRFGSEARS